MSDYSHPLNSKVDANQVLIRSYDAAKNSIRVDAQITVTPGDGATLTAQQAQTVLLQEIENNTDGLELSVGNTAVSAASIDTKTPALGQALAAASIPVVLTAGQLTTLTPLSVVQANAGANLNTSLLALDSTVAKDSSLVSISSKLSTIIDEQNLKVVAVSSLLNAAITNITVAPVTLIGSTAARTLKIQLIEDVGEYMALYTGAVASEVILAAIPLGGGVVSVDVPASTRISIGSLTGAAIVSGKIIINLLGV